MLCQSQASGVVRVLVEDQVPVRGLVIDVAEPGPQAEDLLRHLRRRRVVLPPILVLSAYLTRASLGALIRMEVSGFLAKPFENKQLVDEFCRFFGGKAGAMKHFCPKCFIEAGKDDRCCRLCGTDFGRPPQCPNCMHPFAQGSNFCSNCGVFLLRSTSQGRSARA